MVMRPSEPMRSIIPGGMENVRDHDVPMAERSNATSTLTHKLLVPLPVSRLKSEPQRPLAPSQHASFRIVVQDFSNLLRGHSHEEDMNLGSSLMSRTDREQSVDMPTLGLQNGLGDRGSGFGIERMALSRRCQLVFARKRRTVAKNLLPPCEQICRPSAHPRVVASPEPFGLLWMSLSGNSEISPVSQTAKADAFRAQYREQSYWAWPPAAAVARCGPPSIRHASSKREVTAAAALQRHAAPRSGPRRIRRLHDLAGSWPIASKQTRRPSRIHADRHGASSCADGGTLQSSNSLSSPSS